MKIRNHNRRWLKKLLTLLVAAAVVGVSILGSPLESKAMYETKEAVVEVNMADTETEQDGPGEDENSVLPGMEAGENGSDAASGTDAGGNEEDAAPGTGAEENEEDAAPETGAGESEENAAPETGAGENEEDAAPETGAGESEENAASGTSAGESEENAVPGIGAGENEENAVPGIGAGENEENAASGTGAEENGKDTASGTDTSDSGEGITPGAAGNTDGEQVASDTDRADGDNSGAEASDGNQENSDSDEEEKSFGNEESRNGLVLMSDDSNVKSQENKYYAQMSSSDKSSIRTTFGNYYFTYEEGQKERIAFGFNRDKNIPDGGTYAMEAIGVSGKAQAFYNVCTYPLAGSTWSSTGYRYLFNTVAGCLYYGYPYNQANVNNMTFKQRAVSVYGISEDLADDALRLATQLAIWYTSYKYYSPVSQLYSSVNSRYSKLNTQADPVFCLAAEIAYMAYQNRTTAKNILFDLYKPDNTSKEYMIGVGMINAVSSGEGGEEEQKPGTTITVTAKKIFNGSQLIDGQFSFTLTDDSGNHSWTAKNDADGNITFPDIDMKDYTAGTHTFHITEDEVSDSNITRDDHSYDVTIQVEKYELAASGSIYTGSSPLGIQFGYEMEDGNGNTYLVYCINIKKKNPDSGTTWTSVVDPSDSELENSAENASGYVYDGWCDLPSYTENIRKVLYYFLINPGKYDLKTQQQMMFAMGSTSTQFSNDSDKKIFEIVRNIILDTTLVVPEGYRLVLFKPANTNYQNLVTLVPPDSAEIASGNITFTNTYNNPGIETYRLPETGGAGTIPFIAGGAICITFSLGYILTNKRKKGRKL